MLVYLCTKSIVSHGLQQHAAVILDPVTRRQLYAAIRWDEGMAVHEARAWAARHGYKACEYKARAA